MPAPSSLLFLPGLLCDDRLWRDQVAALRGGIECRVADATQDNGLAAMAARALAAAPPSFGLVALSMGGYLAFEILRQAPTSAPVRRVDEVRAARQPILKYDAEKIAKLRDEAPAKAGQQSAAPTA